MKTRAEIDNKYKIDLKDLYKNDKEFLKELEDINDNIPKLSEFQGHILDSANSLLSLLKLIFMIKI